MGPFFSVVITTYNRAGFLDAALTTLLTQTYTNFEVIVVDNFSDDHTNAVVDRFSDLNIKLFKFRNEGVISLSRNFAINKSAGQWIAFLDSDDLWFPDKLQKSYDAINVNVSLVYHGMALLKNNDIVGKVRTRQLSKPIFEDLLLNGNTIAFSAVVVRKSALEMIQGFNCSRKMTNASDYNAWLKLAERKASFAYLPDTLGVYRIHENNLSNDNYLSQAIAAVEQFVQHLELKKQLKVKNLLIYTQAIVYKSQEKYSLASDYFKLVRFNHSLILWFKSRVSLITLFFHTQNRKHYFEE
jgi:glycosyltransferase involved in cell wall biosynthesis